MISALTASKHRLSRIGREPLGRHELVALITTYTNTHRILEVTGPYLLRTAVLATRYYHAVSSSSSLQHDHRTNIPFAEQILIIGYKRSLAGILAVEGSNQDPYSAPRPEYYASVIHAGREASVISLSPELPINRGYCVIWSAVV